MNENRKKEIEEIIKRSEYLLFKKDRNIEEEKENNELLKVIGKYRLIDYVNNYRKTGKVFI